MSELMDLDGAEASRGTKRKAVDELSEVTAPRRIKVSTRNSSNINNHNLIVI